MNLQIGCKVSNFMLINKIYFQLFWINASANCSSRGPIGSVLGFKDGTWFIHLNRMPGPQRHLNAELSLQTNDSLGSLQMSMDRDMRPWLKSIQHSLRCILWRGPQIEVHPQPLILSRLLMQLPQEFLIN